MPDPKGRFCKGEGGRKPGSVNKTTREIREFAQRMLEDPEYVAALKIRLKRGTAGAIEPLLYHYGYGKPKDTLEIEGGAKPLVIDLLRPDDAAE
jgi:hypothetical protein